MAIETKIGKEAGKYGKIFGVFGAILIIALIIISGPASAFTLNLNFDKASVNRGESVVFTASVDINSNENLPVSKIVLELSGISGGENALCEFKVDGTILSGCKGISIQKIGTGNYENGYGYGNYNSYGYNFGYGYGYNGKLEYKIILYTADYATGTYSTLLKAYIGSEVFSKSGNNLTITESSSSIDYGNSAYRTCPNNGWICSEWSECADGKQIRTCSMLPNCYVETQPEVQRACVVGSKVNSNLNNYENLLGNLNNNLNENSNNGNSNSDNEDKNMGTFGIMQNFLAGITGAVTGTTGVSQLRAWIAVMFLAILAGIVIGLFVVRNIGRARRARRMRELNRIMYRPLR